MNVFIDGFRYTGNPASPTFPAGVYKMAIHVPMVATIVLEGDDLTVPMPQPGAGGGFPQLTSASSGGAIVSDAVTVPFSVPTDIFITGVHAVQVGGGVDAKNSFPANNESAIYPVVLPTMADDSPI